MRLVSYFVQGRMAMIQHPRLFSFLAEITGMQCTPLGPGGGLMGKVFALQACKPEFEFRGPTGKSGCGAVHL